MNSSLRISAIEERPFKCDVPATDKLIAVSKVSVRTLIWFLVLLCHYEICISLTLHYDYQIRVFMSQEFTCLVRNHHTFPLLYCLKIMLIHREGITVHPPCLWSHFLSCVSHVAAQYRKAHTHFPGSLGYGLETPWDYITKMWLPQGAPLPAASHEELHKFFRFSSLFYSPWSVKILLPKEGTCRHVICTPGCNTDFLELTASTSSSLTAFWGTMLIGTAAVGVVSCFSESGLIKEGKKTSEKACEYQVCKIVDNSFLSFTSHCLTLPPHKRRIFD